MTVRLSIKSISSLNFFGDNTEVRVPRGSFRLCCDARCEVSSVFPKPKRECILILISLIFLWRSRWLPYVFLCVAVASIAIWTEKFVNPRGNSLTLLLWHCVYLNSENDESWKPSQLTFADTSPWFCLLSSRHNFHCNCTRSSFVAGHKTHETIPIGDFPLHKFSTSLYISRYHNNTKRARSHVRNADEKRIFPCRHPNGKCGIFFISWKENSCVWRRGKVKRKKMFSERETERKSERERERRRCRSAGVCRVNLLHV